MAWFVGHGLVVCAVWAFAEATLWFIVPDVAIAALALLVPRRWWQAAAIGLAASLAGGLVLFGIASLDGPGTRKAVNLVPGVSSEMLGDVATDLRRDGGAVFLKAPLQGIPYKVFAVEMADQDWSVASFLGWSVPGRALRLVPVAAAAALAGIAFRRFAPDRLRMVLLLYLAGWVAIYVGYFRRVGF